MTLADWRNGAPSPTAPSPAAPPNRAPPTPDSPSPTSTTKAAAATPRRPPSASATATTDSDSPWLDACLRLDPTNPLLVASATALSLVATTRVWNRYGRRIRNADSLKSEDLLRGSRRLKGYVTRLANSARAKEGGVVHKADGGGATPCSVGDADNFRFWHQPTLRPWAKPPTKKSGQSERARRASRFNPPRQGFR